MRCSRRASVAVTRNLSPCRLKAKLVGFVKEGLHYIFPLESAVCSFLITILFQFKWLNVRLQGEAQHTGQQCVYSLCYLFYQIKITCKKIHQESKMKDCLPRLHEILPQSNTPRTDKEESQNLGMRLQSQRSIPFSNVPGVAQGILPRCWNPAMENSLRSMGTIFLILLELAALWNMKYVCAL